MYIYKFRKNVIQLQPPGEPREHRLGKALQGRSKSKFNIILSFFHFDNFQNQPPGNII